MTGRRWGCLTVVAVFSGTGRATIPPVSIEQPTEGRRWTLPFHPHRHGFGSRWGYFWRIFLWQRSTSLGCGPHAPPRRTEAIRRPFRGFRYRERCGLCGGVHGVALGTALGVLHHAHHIRDRLAREINSFVFARVGLVQWRLLLFGQVSFAPRAVASGLLLTRPSRRWSPRLEQPRPFCPATRYRPTVGGGMRRRGPDVLWR